MKLTMAEGRDFSRDFPTDSLGVIVNETAVERMGYTNPVGKYVMWGGHQSKDNRRPTGFPLRFPAPGDRTADHPHERRSPIRYALLVRLRAGKHKEALAGLEKLWTMFEPRLSVHLPVFGCGIQQPATRSEPASQQIGQLLRRPGHLYCLSWIIWAGHLHRRAASPARSASAKYSGANVRGIVALLSKDFLGLVTDRRRDRYLPLAWYIMYRWLDDFEYRTPISWWIFVVAGLSAVGIASRYGQLPGDTFLPGPTR